MSKTLMRAAQQVVAMRDEKPAALDLAIDDLADAIVVERAQGADRVRRLRARQKNGVDVGLDIVGDDR